MEGARDLWLGRLAGATPLPPAGSIHPYCCHDHKTGEPVLALTGAPDADTAEVSLRLDGIELAHRQLDHPMIPKVLFRNRSGEVDLLALACDGVMDIHTALTLLEAENTPIHWPQFTAAMVQLSQPMAHAHDTLADSTGRPHCMAITAWSKFLINSDGQLWTWGYGDSFNTQPRLNDQQWQGTTVAPEVAYGEPPSIRGDINALYQLLIPVLQRLPHTPVLERIVRGQPLPEDQELMEKFLGLNSRLAAGAIEDRPATMRDLVAQMEEIWRLQNIRRDHEGLRQLFTTVCTKAAATRAITLIRPIEEKQTSAPRFWQRGRYRAERRLGQGAAGSVHLAWDRELEQHVAVKSLHHEASATTRQRFVREVRLMRALRHPHIVAGYDLIDEGNVLAAVMEYVPGEPLDQRMRSRLEGPKEIIALVQTMAEGLTALHAADVVHRDLKPANIILHPERGPVIVDLGIARQLDSSLTATGALIGTPLYMAPEQLSGETAEAGSDVFALCTMMLEWLTGEHPFDAENIYHAMLLRTRRTPLLDHAALTPQLRELVAAGMHIDPAQRPSASEVATRLGAITD